MRLATRSIPVLVLLAAVGLSSSPEVLGEGPATRLEVEAGSGVQRIWVDSDDGATRHLLRETADPVVPRGSGQDPSGRARFATWDEAGVRFAAHSRDGGRTWSEAREVRRELRLRAGTAGPGERMPAAPPGYALPPSGRLFVVQFETVSLPEWRFAIASVGGEVLAAVPHDANVVRAGEGALAAIREFEFVARVEPYHPWYRLDPDLRAWLEDGGDPAEERRLRFVALAAGPAGKHRIANAAVALGAREATARSGGHVVELWVTREQLRALAADDDVLSVDRWSAPDTDMDLVREDAGADWVESVRGYCGQGVRGEVMDTGFQLDHPDFDGILTHGPTQIHSHGTSTYGIVFGNGDRDGDGDARATGLLPCAEQGIAAAYNGNPNRFAHTRELKHPPYEASFQTNSWGSGLTTAYTSYAHEMDDLVWQLDIAILNSQSNTGTRDSRPEAWAKNVVSVGGIRHYNTLTPADDAWANGASIGPADDGRIKPDVAYWNDSIFTTTSGGGYTSTFNGTSAATPEVAGVLGLLIQMWSENVWGTDPAGATVFERLPHFSTLKALLINNATQWDFSGSDADLSRVKQGWGRPGARVALERAASSLIVDEDVVLGPDERASFAVDVEAGESELKVTLVYPDPPGTTSAALHRINDLDLTVTSPSGAVYHGNAGLQEGTTSTTGGTPDGLNTVENVFVASPEPGAWSIEVAATEINQDAHRGTVDDDAAFALVVTGATGGFAPAGAARFTRGRFGCDDVVTVEVFDGNVGASSVTVSVGSDSEAAPETVTLPEVAPGFGRFIGSIPATGAPATPGDGVLSVADGDTLTLEYLDADDGAGGGNVPRVDTAVADCVDPVIAGVQHSAVTDSGATIAWSTDEVATSAVAYGEVVPPADGVDAFGLRTVHEIRLEGLRPCTTYRYAPSSADLAGNTTVDDLGGAFHRFDTLGDLGDGLQSCQDGRIDFDVDAVACSADVALLLVDQGLNQDPLAVETWNVRVTSTTEPDGEWVVLTETGANTSMFAGSATTDGAAAVAGDGLVQVADGDLLTASYRDADDGAGGAGVRFDTAVVDCTGPVHTRVEARITDVDAVIEWDLDETGTGSVEWGTTAALGNVASSDTPSPTHAVTIGPLADCERIHYRVVSTDLRGNAAVADAAGDPFELNAGALRGVAYEDGFETDLGWSLDGEWEIAAPQGLGSAPGDPNVAASGAQVLGHDLGGQGSRPGDYEINTNQYATGPVIDASSLPAVELRFLRWLNHHASSTATVEVRDAAGVWQTVDVHSGALSESSWSERVIDISTHAAGNPALRIRFGESARFGFAAGWNVDDLVLRDSTQPTFGGCGGCAGAPSFAGAVSAVDVDPCAGSGITVRWVEAPSWGTGHAGTYSVHRGLTPGFTPSPANLVASGIAGNDWTDPTPPADTSVWYVVRAENDETCGTGPANGGLVDGNTVRVAATDATAQAPPAAVGATLRLRAVNDAHVRLEWDPASGAAAYRVLRSSSPDGGFADLAQPSVPLHEDAGAMVDGAAAYYLVTSVDACGN